MIGFIYLTTNNITGMQYIGKRQTTWGKAEIDRYLGSSRYLKRDIKKYGAHNFSRVILEYANTKEELRLLEIKYLEQYNVVDDDKFYNLVIPAKEPGFTFSKIKRHPEAVLKTANKNRGKKRKKYEMVIKFRNLTDNNLKQIITLHNEGLTPWQMKDIVGYNPKSISNILKDNGLTPHKKLTGWQSKWTETQSKEIVDMYNSGMSCSKIAKTIGRQIGVVSAHLKKLGYTFRKANDYKQITENQSNKIVAMYNDGYTYEKIGEEIGKHAHTISKHLKNLGYTRRKQSTLKK